MRAPNGWVGQTVPSARNGRWVTTGRESPPQTGDSRLESAAMGDPYANEPATVTGSCRR